MNQLEIVDGYLANIGGGWMFVALTAALLGLRHATDPDHLATIITLRMGGDDGNPFRLGLSWGLGHGATMIAIGIPLTIFVTRLPFQLERLLEIAVGLVIIGLALRVMIRAIARLGLAGRLGAPSCDFLVAAHTRSTRSGRGAFAVGLLHGAAGSAGVVALILGRLQQPLLACLAIIVIAIFCALSMAACSWLICAGSLRGYRTAHGEWVVSVAGLLSLGFGLAYVYAAATA